MEQPVGDEGDEAVPRNRYEKICSGCKNRMHTAVKTCRTCGHSFLKGPQKLWKTLNFGMLTVASTALAKVPDALYGGVPALVIVALFGMVSMWLQGLDTRHVRDPRRRNATGKKGVKAVAGKISAAKARERRSGASYTTAELLGHNEILAGISAPAVGGNTTYFTKRFNKGGFGTLLTKTVLLMLAQKLVLCFGTMMFEDYSSAGCALEKAVRMRCQMACLRSTYLAREETTRVFSRMETFSRVRGVAARARALDAYTSSRSFGPIVAPSPP